MFNDLIFSVFWGAAEYYDILCISAFLPIHQNRLRLDWCFFGPRSNILAPPQHDTIFGHPIAFMHVPSFEERTHELKA